MKFTRLCRRAVCAMILCATLPAWAGGDQLEARLNAAFAKGELKGLHAVLVLKDGQHFGEVYFDGHDEAWGTSLGMVQHGPDTLHDLRSISKSVVGLLYGIALSEGKVPPLDASLVAQFPQYPDLAQDPARQAMTVQHALNMTMGTAWNEDLPYTNPRNSEIAMERSPDRFRYVLEQPMVQEPGTNWVYNGGATAVIGHLIEQGTGQRLEAYAQAKLADPLGITSATWTNGFDGRAAAASGLRSTARDLARLGQMVMDGGTEQGRQVVPADWLELTFSPTTQTRSGLRYGNFWWQAPGGNPPRWVAGFGNGGQRLVVNRELGVVLVVFTGNYNQPDAWRMSLRVMTDFVIPAVTAD